MHTVMLTFKELLGESSDTFSLIGATVTGVLAVKYTFRFFRFFTAHFLAGPLGLTANLRKAGSWAVVTGCTDGIGKAFAEQLAARGLNVVLISRTLSKLEDLAKEIEEKFQVSTRVIAVDFTSSGIYEEIRSKLDGLDISVLVNNVGMADEHPDYHGNLDARLIKNVINCNVLSVAKMSNIILPHMVQKKSGYIINVGSSAGVRPLPFISLYCGTKAFVDFFSRSLQIEYSDKGIVIQSLRPLVVSTKMTKLPPTKPFIPSSTTYVRDALNTVGILPETTGFWAHSIQGVIMSAMPTFVIKKMLQGTRDEGIKKKAAANKTQ